MRSGLQGLLGLNKNNNESPARILGEYVDALAEILSPPDPENKYLGTFLRRLDGQVECIGTLNYDTLLEQSAVEVGVQLDFGISHWNTRRIIQFAPGKIRLLKLHGSLEWYFEGDDDVVVRRSPNLAGPFDAQ